MELEKSLNEYLEKIEKSLALDTFMYSATSTERTDPCCASRINMDFR